MYPLIATVKTGYKITNPNIPVIIRDNRGILFYTTEEMVPRITSFNLPPGKYLVDSGMFAPMSTPVNFGLLSLPMNQRLLKSPLDFKVIFGNNPNKCSVLWNKDTILFDNSFKEKPLPQVQFILGHEFGHQFYTTEKYCDLFSANRMLKKGYNPSQIGLSPLDSLSEAQYERKKMMVTKLSRNAKNQKQSFR